jgi:HEAT repeat protein
VAAVPLVLGGVLFAARDQIRELWHLHRLRAGDLDEKKAAIEALGELRSERAAPRLLEIVRTDVDLGPRAVAALVQGREEAPEGLLESVRGRPADFLSRAVAAIERGDPSPGAGSVLVAIALHGPKAESPEAVQWEAVRVLDGLGRDYVPDLLQVLAPDEDLTSIRAVILLGRLGPRAAQAVPALAALLRREDGNWSAWAASSLAAIGAAAVPALSASLEGETEEERVSAARGLERMGAAAAPAVPALVHALKDSKYRVREQAASALGAIGPAAGAAIPSLLSALKDPAFGQREPREGEIVWVFNGPAECYDARREAALALGRIAAGAPEVVVVLAETLEDPNWCVALAAVRALETMGPAAGAVAPRLAVLIDRWLWDATLGDRRAGHAREVIEALVAVGSDRPEVLGALRKALAGKDEVSIAAAEALSRLGNPSSEQASALIAALASPVEEASWPVMPVDDHDLVRALAKIGPEAVPPLVRALASEQPRLRRGAARALVEMGSAAREALPALQRLIADSDAETRWAALSALATGTPDEFLSTFVAALDDPDQHVRALAVQVCGKARAEAAVPRLFTLLESGTDEPGSVLSALAAIVGPVPEVRAAVLKALGDVNPWVRLDAIRALEGLGTGSSEVVTALARALNETGPAARHSDYYRVREAAAARLAALGRADVVLAGLRNADARVRSMAARALGNIRPAVRGARAALETLLIDERDEYAANEARGALDSLRQILDPAVR